MIRTGRNALTADQKWDIYGRVGITCLFNKIGTELAGSDVAKRPTSTPEKLSGHKISVGTKKRVVFFF